MPLTFLFLLKMNYIFLKNVLTSNDSIIYSFANKFYPPAIFVKHNMWFLPAADLFISLNGVLYGVH
jgi:hypothetical protein